jgi:hypothetical protein
MAMRNILPQLNRVGTDYNGSKPLPRRLERVAALMARDEFSKSQLAAACRVSPVSIWRLQQQPAFRARLRVLRQQLADAALEDEPLALKGNRVSVAGRMVRTLNRDQRWCLHHPGPGHHPHPGAALPHPARHHSYGRRTRGRAGVSTPGRPPGGGGGYVRCARLW